MYRCYFSRLTCPLFFNLSSKVIQTHTPIMPSCSISALTCPLLSPIEGARPECTNDNYFRSICSFNCDEGYDMPPQVSKALVCQNDKTWRKHGEPRCIGTVQNNSCYQCLIPMIYFLN